MQQYFHFAFYTVIFGFLFFPQQAQPQITLGDTVVSFGSVAAGQQHKIALELVNHNSWPVYINAADFEEDVFSCDLRPGEIAATTAIEFHVYFQAEQNINFTDFLRLHIDSLGKSLIVKVSAQAVYPEAYYAATQNKWAEELKIALKDIIDNHTSLGYTSARDQMYGSIDNYDGWVECVYTGRKAKFSDRSGADANNFNCEHTIPQSFFKGAEPMRSDIYHIYPTDKNANSQRGSYDFGKVQNAQWTEGGSKLGIDADGITVFEPRDVHKGNVARSHFYFSVRYGGQYNGYQNAAKMENHFRFWNVSDSVDDAEQQRNEEIFALQKNRNPFIDHPELAERISSFYGQAVKITAPEIAVAPRYINMCSIHPYEQSTFFLALINTGDASLVVNDISTEDNRFTPDKTMLNIPGESCAYVTLTFSANEQHGLFSTQFKIKSNDADESLIEIPVQVSVVTGMELSDEHFTPTNIQLMQNYPNPFNPATTISFILPQSRRVELHVFDIHGRLIETLINRRWMNAGRHSVVFTGQNLPSGIYFYRLSNERSSTTKSMLLIR